MLTLKALQEPAVPPVSAHPPRIRTVIPAKFHPKKLLGQGGQGTVHLGDYDGLPCAGMTCFSSEKSYA
jgi:hypothetical protein